MAKYYKKGKRQEEADNHDLAGGDSDDEFADASDFDNEGGAVTDRLQPSTSSANGGGGGPATNGDDTGDRVVMVDYDMQDEADGQDVMNKLGSVKVAWDKEDVRWWFTELENQMTLINIRSQWVKRVIVSNNLPEDVKAQVKDILKKPKSQAPTTVYKVIKTKVLNLFGPKEGENFEKAFALELTTTPSALAKRLVELLCQCEEPLGMTINQAGDVTSGDCCQAETISALWRRKLPQQVRTRIAGQSLRQNYDVVLQLADDVYASLDAPATARVAATQEAAPAPAGNDEIAAYGRGGQGRGQRGRSRGRSRGRGGRGGYQSGGQQQQQQRGGATRSTGRNPNERHPDGPPENSCKIHWLWGRQAYFCADKENCPWKNFVTNRN